MSIRTTLLAAVATVGLMSAANAVPLAANSSINLNGYVQANGGTNIMTATSLDFTNGNGPTVGTPGMLTSYSQGTGSFAGLSCGTSGGPGTSGSCGLIQDIANLAVGAQTITNFVSLSGGNNAAAINFSLSSIDSITRNVAGFLLFSASGTINYDGFSPTAGTFLFSAQGNTITSFSGTTLAAASVPEPMSLALLGGSLAALGLVRRRKA